MKLTTQDWLQIIRIGCQIMIIAACVHFLIMFVGQLIEQHCHV